MNLTLKLKCGAARRLIKAAKIWSDLWLAGLEQLRVFFLSLCISLFHVPRSISRLVLPVNQLRRADFVLEIFVIRGCGSYISFQLAATKLQNRGNSKSK